MSKVCMILLSWILMHVDVCLGIQAIGYSGVLANEQTYGDSSTSTSSIAPVYSLSTGWSVESDVAEYGFYNYDAFKNDDEYPLLATAEGLYYLSGNIIIQFVSRDIKRTLVSLFFATNSSSQLPERYCRTTKYLEIGELSTVSLSCFTRLRMSTQLKLALQMSPRGSLIAVKKMSTISLQFIGSSGIIPSLVLPLHEVDKTQKTNFRYFNSLTVVREKHHIVIPCTGTFIVSLSLSFETEIPQSNASLSIQINEYIVFNLTFSSYVQQKPFLEAFHLQKDDFIKINYSADIEFTFESTYAIIRTWNGNQDPGTVTYALEKPQETTYDGLYQFRLDNPTKRFSMNTSKLEKQADNATLSVRHGLYFVTLELYVETEDAACDVTIAVSEDEELTEEFSGIRGKISSIRSGSSRLIQMYGILEFRADSYLTVVLSTKEKLRVRSGYLGISQIQQNTLVAAFTLRQAPTFTNKNKLHCKDYMLLLKQEPVSNFLLNEYILPNDGAGFEAPDSGTYLIHMLGTFRLVANRLVNVTVHLRQYRNDRMIAEVNYFTFPNSAGETESFAHIMQMYKSDQIRVQISCEKYFKLVKPIKTEVILLHTGTVPNHITSDNTHRNRNTSNLSDNRKTSTEYPLPNPGVYFVTVRVLLRVSNLKKTTKVHLQVKKQTINILTQEKTLNPMDMPDSGLFTMNIFGFADFALNDNIQTEVYIVPDDLTKSTEDKSGLKFSLDVLKESVEYTLLTDKNRKMYGFRAVQMSSKLFHFKNKMTIPDNFQLIDSVGGFKLPSTQLFGSYFIVNKPMTMFYEASVTLQKTIGTYGLKINIRPNRGMEEISSSIQIHKENTITLRASGLLVLGVGDSVEFIVHGDPPNNVVLCSNSFWSLIEITMPSTKFYGKVLDRNNYAKQDMLRSDLYVARSNTHHNRVQLNREQRLNEIPTEIYRIKTLNQNDYLQNGTLQYGDLLNDNASCRMFLIESNANRMRIESSDLTYDRLDSTNQDLMLLCLTPNRTITVPENDTSLRVLSSSVEAFAVTLLATRHVNVAKYRPKRIDGWTSQVQPYFDRSHSYLEGRGAYTVPYDGFYLVAIRLLLASKCIESCTLDIRIDEQLVDSIPASRITIFNDIISMQKESVLQVTIGCRSNCTISAQPKSTFSILQTDSRVSLPMKCSSPPILQLSTVNDIVFTQVEVPYRITCQHSEYLVGDFVWTKNGEVIMVTQGKRESSVEFKRLKMDDSGNYECRMERSKIQNFLKNVEIVVIDPRPSLEMSDSIVYVEENTTSNAMVAWVRVAAYDLITNKRAAVRLTIVEGDDENLFYFEPEETKFVASLKHRKPLDFEQQQSFTLTFRADNVLYDDQLGMVEKQIRVQVVNRNEHQPKFELADNTINVSEDLRNGSMVKKFSAVDLDLNSTKRLSFSLVKTSNSNLFRMETKTGRLLTAREIDYESVQEVFLIVVVTDGVYKTYQDVMVKVKNVNDNHPRFIQQNYQLNITDTKEPGSHILSLSATDRDALENQPILNYSIITGNDKNYFKLLTNNLILFKKVRLGENFLLNIVAYDSGGLQSENNATVRIQVTSNPSSLIAPNIFKKHFDSIDLSENTPINSPIMQLDVSTVPLLITYKLKVFGGGATASWDRDERNYFRISQNASLFVSKNIDYEKTKICYLVASACVLQSEKESCDFYHLTINVKDTNDNPPMFTRKNMTYEIFENKTQPNALIGRIEATDADEGENGIITYKLEHETSSVTSPLVEINRTTGDLHLVNKNVSMLQPSSVFKVIASDNGSPSLVQSAQIVIVVRPSPSPSTNLSTDTLNNAAVAVNETSSSNHKRGSVLMPYLHWKYTIPVSLLVVLIVFAIALALILRNAKKSKKRLNKYHQEELRKAEEKSLLKYWKVPAESIEATVKFSCESIPAAYKEADHNIHWADCNVSKLPSPGDIM